jgi:TonB-linked SusC/RagA family outer membrane protein
MKIYQTSDVEHLCYNSKTIMKLTFVLFFAFMLSALANTFGQTEISINVKNKKIVKVLDEIEAKTDFKFIYRLDIFDFNKKVSLKAEKALIKDVLDQLFENKIVYYIRDTKVLLKQKDRNEVSSTLIKSMDQIETIQKSINGKVTDDEGNPLPGATIIEEGTNNGTTSDFDGNFSIILENENSILKISYVGYLSQSIITEDRSNFNITLIFDNSSLDEVVVVGFGTQKKINLTGSIAVLENEQIENRPTSNVTTALAGQLPGLTVSQQRGRPGGMNGQGGADSNAGGLNVRGVGSLGDPTGIVYFPSKNAPLVLIDGIVGDMTNLDVNDIQSVSLLKDAASAAIYGVRAANGVILITTKKGKTGEPIIKYHGGIGVSEPYRTPERVGAFQYATMYNAALSNDGSALRYTDDDLNKWSTGSSPNSHPDNDQYEQLINSGNGIRNFHNLSASGGTEKTNYSLSLGHFDENGIIELFDYSRTNYRLNFEQTIGANEKLKVGVNLSGVNAMQSGSTQLAGGLIENAYTAHPGDVIQYENGLWAAGQDWTAASGTNAIAFVKAPLGTYDQNYNDYINSIFAEYDLTNDVKIRGRVTYRNDNKHGDFFDNFLKLYRYNSSLNDYTVGASFNGSIRAQYDKRKDVTNQLIATYQKQINSHNFSVLLGYEQLSFTSTSIDAGRTELTGNNTITQLNGVDPSNDQAFGDEIIYGLRSGFGRVNYNFNEKYLFEANVRYDGTSRFPTDTRFAAFPSFSAGWNLSEENFFDSDIFQNLKIRASWGKLGNQEVGDYLFRQTLGSLVSRENIFGLGNVPIVYSFGNTAYTGLDETAVANSDITWETTTISDVGIDMSIFNNKVTFTADYFKKTTNDILLSLPQPAILGMLPPTINAASVDNEGFEIAITHQNKTSGDLNYFINTNLSYVKNEITDLKGSDAPGRSVGDPINNIFGYVADGIFNSQAEIDAAPDQTSFGGAPVPGDIRYVDINNDGVVDPSDRESLGSYFPEYTFGLTAGLNWKNFDFSMVWQGAAGFKALTTGPYVQPFYNAARPLQNMVNNTWTEQNQGAFYPRLSVANQARNYQSSSYWTRDSSFAKLRNLQIGYSLPPSILNSLKIKMLRLYITGENLLHISNIKDLDPEFANGDPFAFSAFSYPSSRFFSTGINITF